MLKPTRALATWNKASTRYHIDLSLPMTKKIIAIKNSSPSKADVTLKISAKLSSRLMNLNE